MHHGVLAAKTCDTERKVLDNDAGGLSVDEVTVGKRILEHCHNGVGVVRGLWADVLEHEGECLQTAGTNIQLSRAVFV